MLQIRHILHQMQTYALRTSLSQIRHVFSVCGNGALWECDCQQDFNSKIEISYRIKNFSLQAFVSLQIGGECDDLNETTLLSLVSREKIKQSKRFILYMSSLTVISDRHFAVTFRPILCRLKLRYFIHPNYHHSPILCFDFVVWFYARSFLINLFILKSSDGLHELIFIS